MKDKGRKGTTLFNVGGNEEKQDEQQEFLSLYSKTLSTIASGATPIESASHAPNETRVIKNMEQALEHIIDYLVKR
jgi:hypothetical protein